MEIYERVAIIVQESSTTDSKKNKLLKLRYTITDSQLLKLLDEMIFALTYHLGGGRRNILTPEQKAKGIPETWQESHILTNRCATELRMYAEAKLVERTPQW